MCAHKGQRMTLAILLYHSPPYFFETHSLTEPRTMYGGGQQASVILLSLSNSAEVSGMLMATSGSSFYKIYFYFIYVDVSVLSICHIHTDTCREA